MRCVGLAGVAFASADGGGGGVLDFGGGGFRKASVFQSPAMASVFQSPTTVDATESVWGGGAGFDPVACSVGTS